MSTNRTCICGHSDNEHCGFGGLCVAIDCECTDFQDQSKPELWPRYFQVSLEDKQLLVRCSDGGGYIINQDGTASVSLEHRLQFCLKANHLEIPRKVAEEIIASAKSKSKEAMDLKKYAFPRFFKIPLAVGYRLLQISGANDHGFINQDGSLSPTASYNLTHCLQAKYKEVTIDKAKEIIAEAAWKAEQWRTRTLVVEC